MTHLLDSLNTSQKEAVEKTQGALLILAGPGSGKTRVITHRIAYLLGTVGISPRRILAVTFTNKAANEMKERLNNLVGTALADNLTVGTFHAICARMLRMDGSVISLPKDFVIYDREDQLSLVKRCMEKAGISKEIAAPSAVIAEISKAKSTIESAKEYALRAASFFEKQCAEVYLRYQNEMAQSKALDFDDIIMKTIQMFDFSSEVLKHYQNRYQYVMVDEFQDTSPVQYQLIKKLADGGNICVVGDADQSIYSWRNADIRNIINFEKDYPQAQIIRLEQNYRSTENILGAASSVIVRNKARKTMKLWTQNGAGEKIVVNVCADPKEESQYIVKEIEDLVTSGRVAFKEVAVLYRANSMSRAIEEAFVRYGMPYRLAAGVRFYERREIKDIVAYLRLVQNPYDSVSFLRVVNVPARGLGDKSLNDISRWAEDNNKSVYDALAQLKNNDDQAIKLTPRAVKALTAFYDLLENWRLRTSEVDICAFFDLVCADIKYKDYLLAQENGEERWENVNEFRSTLRMYSGSAEQVLPTILENVALMSDVDSLASEASAVTLITLHQAKGLEFAAVFIVGVEENILPHMRSALSQDELEEERRLFYVGMTRAKKYLYLTRCEGRMNYGGFGMNEPSRFLADIPEQYLKNQSFYKTPTPIRRAPHQNDVYGYARTSHEVAQSGMKTVLNKERFAPWDASAHYEEKYIEIPVLQQGDKVRHSMFGDGTVLSYKEQGSDAVVIVQFWGEVGQKKLLASFANLNKIG